MGMYAYCIYSYSIWRYPYMGVPQTSRFINGYNAKPYSNRWFRDTPHLWRPPYINDSWQTLFSIFSKQLKDETWLNYLSKVGDYMWSATFLFFLWRRHPCHRQNRLRLPAKFGPNSWWRTSFWQSSPPTLGETNGWFLHFFHFIQVWESVSKTLLLSVKTHFFWP